MCDWPIIPLISFECRTLLKKYIVTYRQNLLLWVPNFCVNLINFRCIINFDLRIKFDDFIWVLNTIYQTWPRFETRVAKLRSRSTLTFIRPPHSKKTGWMFFIFFNKIWMTDSDKNKFLPRKIVLNIMIASKTSQMSHVELSHI